MQKKVSQYGEALQMSNALQMQMDNIESVKQ